MSNSLINQYTNGNILINRSYNIQSTIIINLNMDLQLQKCRIQVLQQKDLEKVQQLFCDSYLQTVNGLMNLEMEKTRIKKSMREFYEISQALNALRSKKIPMNLVVKIDDKIVACSFACDIRMLPIPNDSKNQIYMKFLREIKLSEIPYGEAVYEGLSAIHKDYRKFGLFRRIFNFKDQLFMHSGYSQAYYIIVSEQTAQMMKTLYRAQTIKRYQLDGENSKKLICHFLRRDISYYPSL